MTDDRRSRGFITVIIGIFLCIVILNIVFLIFLILNRRILR